MTASRSTRRAARAVARRPPARTIDVVIESGDFAGWYAKCRADFPASLVAGLDSGRLDDALAALQAIIVEHNMPNDRDELAATLADVDPYTGLLAIADELGRQLKALPNR